MFEKIVPAHIPVILKMNWFHITKLTEITRPLFWMPKSCHWSKEGAGLYPSPHLEARQSLLQFRMQQGIITLSLRDHMNPIRVSLTVIFSRFPLKFYIFVWMYLLMYIGQYRDSKCLEMQVQKSLLSDDCEEGITTTINLHNGEIPSPLNSLKSLPLLCQSHLAQLIFTIRIPFLNFFSSCMHYDSKHLLTEQCKDDVHYFLVFLLWKPWIIYLCASSGCI